MKKIFLFSLIMFVAVAHVSAQHNKRNNSDINIEDVEYKSVVLSHPEVRELMMVILVDLRIIEGEEGYIEISYPVVEEEYIKFGVYDNCKFMIGRNGEKRTPKNTILSDEIPVRMTVSLPLLRTIFGNDAMIDISVERDSFDNTLNIRNGLAMWIKASSITAADSIEIFNNGTLTLEVDNWNTDRFKVFNGDGYVYLHGSTDADYVEYRTSQQDNVELNVACEDLIIFSRSEGILNFTGSADNVQVVTQKKSKAIISYPMAM